MKKAVKRGTIAAAMEMVTSPVMRESHTSGAPFINVHFWTDVRRQLLVWSPRSFTKPFSSGRGPAAQAAGFMSGRLAPVDASARRSSQDREIVNVSVTLSLRCFARSFAAHGAVRMAVGWSMLELNRPERWSEASHMNVVDAACCRVKFRRCSTRAKARRCGSRDADAVNGTGLNSSMHTRAGYLQ